jgi:hypothetical protein
MQQALGAEPARGASMDGNMLPLTIDSWPLWLAPLAEGGADRIMAYCTLRDLPCPPRADLEQQLEVARRLFAYWRLE